MNSRHLNKVAEQVADKVGSPISILIHTALFLINYGLMFVFDPDRVIDVLTNWVSIEAIYLTLFMLLHSTNQQKNRKCQHCGQCAG